MKINELAQKAGLKAPTIRYYEKEGIIDSWQVRRKENNYRDYSEEAVEHLQMIKRLQSAGFTLAELKVMVQNGGINEISTSRKVEVLRRKLKEIESKKEELNQVQALLEKMLSNKIAFMNNE